MDRRTIGRCLLALVVICSSGANAAGRDGWVPLLNPNDFDGWYTVFDTQGIRNDPDRVFTIKDGVVHVYKYAEPGTRVPQGYLSTEKSYGDYHLRLQYKWGEKKFKPQFEWRRDGGIFYHLVGRDKVWPQTLQLQVQENNVGDQLSVDKVKFDTTIDPATREFFRPGYLPAEKGGVPMTIGGSGAFVHWVVREFHNERAGWNTLEVIARGDSAVHILNGRVIGRFTNIRYVPGDGNEEWVPLTRGRIGLEIEAAEIFFRNVEIRPLDANAPEPQPTRVPADSSWTNLFNGKNLDGFSVLVRGHKKNEDPDRIVQVHDGMIHLYKDTPANTKMPYGMIVTDRDYGNYHLRMEYKWGEKRFAPRQLDKRDAGLLYHVYGPNQVWPPSVEFQIQEGDTGDLIYLGAAGVTTIDPATSGQTHPHYKEFGTSFSLDNKATFDAQGLTGLNQGWVVTDRAYDRLQDWNTIELIAHGDEVVHMVNGQIVNRAIRLRRPDPKDPDGLIPLTSGRIALQLEQAEVFYRNIQIRPLE